MTKVLLILAGMLFSTEALAAHYIVGKQWVIPVEREDGTLLPLAQISHHTMYRVSCADHNVRGEIIQADIYNALTMSFWISTTPIDCFVMTTHDTDGRVSKFSEVFYAVEYDAPQPVGCGP